MSNPRLTVVGHPLVQHKLSYLRDKSTPTVHFRQLAEEITLLLTYEATKDMATEDAVIETPTVLAMFPDRTEGVLRGRAEIEKLFAANLRAIGKEFRALYRSSVFLANGKLLMWEYPRKTPTGTQVDLIESMDIENGLIVYHRVYWGWQGLKVLLATRDKRAA